MPKGEIRNKKDYVDWIRQVRKKSGMNQEEFGRRIIRFSGGKKDARVSTYGRGAVIHWEKGTHLPVNLETVVSIALLDYTCMNPEISDEKRALWTSGQRKNRMEYALSCVSKYLNRSLYCKNLRDVLLFQAMRGIFLLQDVPDLDARIREEMLNCRKGQKKIQPETIREYARNRNTGTLYSRLMEVENAEQFFVLLEEKKDFYSIGYRVVGERMREEYEKGYQKQSGLDFHNAIHFYAPVYRDSYQRMFQPEMSVSRRWLIDLCLQLHFDGNSMDRVLENAHYAPLSRYPDNPESWIFDGNGVTCGSIAWYSRMEERYLRWKEHYGDLGELQEDGAVKTDFSPLRFWRLGEYTLKERMIYGLGAGCYALKYQELPLPVYLLDYMPARKDMEELLKGADRFPSKAGWKGAFFQWRKEESGLCQTLTNRIKNAMDDIFFATEREEERLVEKQAEEYGAYLEISKEQKEETNGIFAGSNRIFQDSAFILQRYYAALLYSLLTGYLFKGRIQKNECQVLQQIKAKSPESSNFLHYIWRLYLGTDEIKKGKQGYFLMLKKGPGPELNLEKMAGILAEMLERV